MSFRRAGFARGICCFFGSREEKQIPRFARDDKKYFFRSLFSLSSFDFVVGLKEFKTRQAEACPT